MFNLSRPSTLTCIQEYTTFTASAMCARPWIKKINNYISVYSGKTTKNFNTRVCGKKQKKKSNLIFTFTARDIEKIDCLGVDDLA